MSYKDVSRNGVDTATPLDFPQRQSKNDLTITIKSTIDGFGVEVCFTGSIDQLLQVTKRLRELGGTPIGASDFQKSEAPAPSRQAAQRYDANGDAMCPVHHKALRGPNKWGKLYCSAKDDDGAYCKYTLKDA